VSKLLAFDRRMLVLSAASKKPTPEAKATLSAELLALCAPIKAVENDRKTAFTNFAKAVHESIPAFQWVFADNGAGGMLEAASESADFWANKVRKDSKEKAAPEWMAWANALRDTHKALAEFVKEHYKQGMTYNVKGGAFPGVTGSDSGSAAPAAAAAAAAPAAPAAAAAPATAATPAPAPAGGARPNLAGLFSQIGSIDQSSGKTAGLRHVDKKEVAAAKAAAAPTLPAAPKPAAAPAARRGDLAVPTGEAKVECENGLRWKIDFCANNKAAPMHLADVTTKQDIYIYAAQNAVIYIDSKVRGEGGRMAELALSRSLGRPSSTSPHPPTLLPPPVQGRPAGHLQGPHHLCRLGAVRHRGRQLAQDQDPGHQVSALHRH